MRQFEGLGTATPGKKGRFLGAGQYTLVVRECKFAPNDPDLFITEFVILACNDAICDSKQPFKPGQDASWSANLRKGAEFSRRPEENLAIKDIKGFCIGTFDCEGCPEEITKEFGAMLVGPEQPARGRIVHAVAITKPQKKNPDKDFTHLSWSPASAETYEQYAETVRELLG
jgi:hypothetical protein